MLATLYRHHRTEPCYILYVGVYVCLGLFMSSLYDQFFIIIFIFVTIIISLKQTHLFFGCFCQNFNLRVLPNFSLFFCQFQPGVAYKSVAYK